MIRILLADDHAIFREGLAGLFNSDIEFNLVAEASRGDEAWQLIQKHLPDVAILDITMPGLNGIEVGAHCQRAGLKTKTVLLTSHDDPSLVIQGQDVGMLGYVLKENSFEELRQAVRVVNSGKSYVSEQVAKKRDEFLYCSQKKRLSPREKEVLTQIALGHTNKEVARILNITPRTVDTHKTRLKEKLQLRNISDLSRYAIRIGLVA
ncbi:MAG: response regulator transcription factor [Magnetococcales bacterium]|nr:response regulator transcription factor [Magnetococcales bacterium]